MEAWVGPKIGYLLPTRERMMEGSAETRRLEAWQPGGRTAAATGRTSGGARLRFDLDLRFAVRSARHEPLVMLAGVAARTERVLLGTGVLLPELRNPVQLAHRAATLDQIG